MATNRKLQSDVDRTLKKVDEGIELFDTIWDKVYAAPNQTQKEKFESDLKKEIKKLQRLRDQIKQWLAGNDFKDKGFLTEKKKVIERKMEQFKVCERETKTKAYSREGLAKAGKLDPDTEKRLETRGWVQDFIQLLRDKVEAAEAEIEELENEDNNDGKIREAEDHINQHVWHTERLEMIMRALDNEAIDPEEVDEIKENVEYYIESGQDPDYYHDEALYDALDLEGKLAEKTVNVDVVAPAVAKKKKNSSKDKDSSVGPASKTETKSTKTKDKDSVSKKREKEKKSAHEKLLAAQVERQRLLAQEEARKEQLQKEREEQLKMQVEEQGVDAKVTSQNQASLSLDLLPNIESTFTSASTQPSPISPRLNVMPADQLQREANIATAVPLPLPTIRPPMVVADDISNSSIRSPEVAVAESTRMPNTPQGAIQTADRGVQDGVSMPAEEEITVAAQDPDNSSSNGFQTMVASSTQMELDTLMSWLQTSYLHCPTELDAEDPSDYDPDYPCPVPSVFPQMPVQLFENPLMFDKLDDDTLFFIFYHQQGSYQQYLAAKALKKKSWRYHKKYFTWFLRHKEPTVTTADYEVGTYVYFDYEIGWCQRIREDFTFEYAYLEDDPQTVTAN